jgi:hypothetical protein
VSRLLVLVVIFMSAPLSFSQTLDQLAEYVVFLYRVGPKLTVDGKPLLKDNKPEAELKFGTGFLVSPDNKTMVLVTAEHVSAIMKSDFRVTVHGQNDTPIDMSSEEITGAKNVNWVTHGREDVAVAVLHPDVKISMTLKGRFMPGQQVSLDSKAPSRERPLTALGFPLAIVSAEYFSPISRDSKPASGLVTLKRSDTGTMATFFLLDNPSIEGFSGAPLFQTSAPYPSSGGMLVMPETPGPGRGVSVCVGVIHGTISDNTGGKMAAVTPSQYVRETIDKAMSH